MLAARDATAKGSDVTELHELTALEQAAAIRRREISSLELTEHYIARTDATGDTVGAFITRTDDLARDMARAADQKVADADPDEPLGVLHGTVVPAKDLVFVAGVRCTLGSVAYDMTPYGDDHVVTRMKQGGLVITGKTNTPEFGLPCYTEPDVAPPARTPWDLTRGAGGSSGGAAAAVAAGLASAGHGSDGGGSIRIPASVTGLVGIKPARGRISNGPLRDPVGELPHQGVLARTVRDAAALLDVMAGRVPGRPVPRAAAAGRRDVPRRGRPRPGPAAHRALLDAGHHRDRRRPRVHGGVRRGERAARRARPRGRGHRAAVRPRAGRVVRVGLVGARVCSPRSRPRTRSGCGR